MTTKFSLSEKRLNMFSGYKYPEADVKEFIRLLIKKGTNKMWEKRKHPVNPEEWDLELTKADIDELAGDKLKGDKK